VNVQEFATEGRRLSQLLDDALGYLKRQVQEAAAAERDYRHAKAKAWVEAPAGTVPEREAWVNGVTADLRYRRDLADNMRRAAWQVIESRRQQINLLQSIGAAEREAMAFARTGPELEPVA
jgi:hypothetical protein